MARVHKGRRHRDRKMGLVSQPSCSNVAACIKLQVTLSISTPALEMKKYQYYLVKTRLRFAQQKLKPIRFIAIFLAQF